jgi:hypothetical protein
MRVRCGREHKGRVDSLLTSALKDQVWRGGRKCPLRGPVTIQAVFGLSETALKVGNFILDRLGL